MLIRVLIFSLLIILPLFTQCQDSNSQKLTEEVLSKVQVKSDSIRTAQMNLISEPMEIMYHNEKTNKTYKVSSTIDLFTHLWEFLAFMEKYDIEFDVLEDYDGIYTVTNLDLIARDTNEIGLTYKKDPTIGRKAISFLDYKMISTPFSQKVLLYHEMTHVLTENVMPHCEDFVNCSCIFMYYLEGMDARAEKFWELETEQLANMIKIYQKYSKKPDEYDKIEKPKEE